MAAEGGRGVEKVKKERAASASPGFASLAVIAGLTILLRVELRAACEVCGESDVRDGGERQRSDGGGWRAQRGLAGRGLAVRGGGRWDGRCGCCWIRGHRGRSVVRVWEDGDGDEEGIGCTTIFVYSTEQPPPAGTDRTGQRCSTFVYSRVQ